MSRITCTTCQQPRSLDETTQPLKAVGLPCPVCKAKLIVDRRKFEKPAAEPAAAPEAAQPSVQQQAHDDDDDHENDFGSKALIVGADNPLIRQSAKLIG